MGAGVLTGVVFASVFASGATSGPAGAICTGFGLVAAGGYMWLVEHYVIARLDRPQPMYVLQQLAHSQMGPQGRLQTHVRVPAVHPQTGQPVWSRPRSTFFFIPTRIFVAIFPIIGLAMILVYSLQILA